MSTLGRPLRALADPLARRGAALGGDRALCSHRWFERLESVISVAAAAVP